MTARERIGELEGELEDAWREAERAAREIDELADGMSSDNDEEEEAVIKTAAVIVIPTPQLPRLPLGEPLQLDSLPMITPLPGMSPISPISPRLLEMAKDKSLPMLPPDADVPESASLRSWKSTTKSARSGKSTRNDGSRLLQVTAAKTRSYRTSKGSLRFPKLRIPENRPPVPDIPLEFTSIPLPPASPTASSKVLHGSQATAHSVPPPSNTKARRRRISLDDIMPPCKLTISYPPNTTVDDIYVRPHNLPHHRYFDLESYQPPDHQKFEIEIVPRTPPPLDPEPQNEPSEEIPSMWLNPDSAPPKTRAELFEAASARTRQNFKKFKTITKRYSMSLPLFRSSSSSIKSASRPPSRQSS